MWKIVKLSIEIVLRIKEPTLPIIIGQKSFRIIRFRIIIVLKDRDIKSIKKL